MRLGMGIIEVPDDLLREGFVQVPVKLLRLPDIGLGAKLCYCCLLWYAWKVGYFPGQNALAQEFGSTDRSVRNYFTELQRAGLIEIRRPARRGEVLSIRLTPSSEWPEAPVIPGPAARGIVAPVPSSPEAKGTSRRKRVPSSPETKTTSRRKKIPVAEEEDIGNQRQNLPGSFIHTNSNREEAPRRTSHKQQGLAAENTTKNSRKAQALSEGKEEDNIFADLPAHYLMAMLGFARGLLERGRTDELVVEVLQGQGLSLEQAQEVLRILRSS